MTWWRRSRPSLPAAWRRGQWAAVAVAALALCPGSGAAWGAQGGDLVALLEARVGREVAAHHLPGAALAVVCDGEVACLRGYGWADVEAGRPVDPETTLFRVGSVSKVVTWVCLLQLWESGRLDLHADINRYLRGVRIPATYPDPITAAHLITHTAGFEERLLGVSVAGSEDLRPLGRWVRDAMPARVRPPGELSGYCNYGAALAGYVVECVAGMPFERYVEEHVFGPLGMARSTFSQPPPAGWSTHMARGYRRVRGRPRRGEEEWVQAVPAGAMCTSAGDMAGLMLSLLDGDTPLIGDEGRRLLRTRRFAHDPRVPGWTYGLAQDTIGGHDVLWHNGATRLFHATLMLLPDLNAGWFVVCNGSDGGQAVGAVRDAVLEHLAPPAAAVAPGHPAGSPDRARRCAGEYEPSRSNRTTLEKFARPFSPVRVRATRRGELLLSSGGTTRRYSESAPYVFDCDGARDRLVFATEDGRVRALYGGLGPSAAGLKLPWWEGSSLHLSLLGLCLAAFLSLFPRRLWALVRPATRPGGRGACVEWLLCLLSGLNVLFVVGLALLLLCTVRHPYGYPLWWAPLSYLPWATAALALAAMGLLVVAWARWGGRLLCRLHQASVALAGGLFTLLAAYWNLMAR